MSDRLSTSTPGSFWQELTAAEKSALRVAARQRLYAVGASLMHQGDESEHVIVIEDGWAKVSSSTESGHEVMLAVRGPGDLVGESAVLGGRKDRSATVRAVSPLRALVLSGERFLAFLDEHPRAWRPVSNTVVRRLEAADARLQAHATGTGSQRLALLLLELAELSEQVNPPGPDGSIEILPPLSQQELAEWTDAARETVARALKIWRDRGLIKTGWRKITILDPPGLHDYVFSKEHP